MAKSADGFKSVAAAKKASGKTKKAKAQKAKRIAAAHKASGFDSIKATFVRGGAVRPK